MQRKLLAISIAGIVAGIYTNSWGDEPDVLDTIVVTATRTELASHDAPGSVTVITRRQIRQSGSDNIVDIIRDAPGVSLQGIGTGGRKTLSVRGLESKHVLVLVDGKRIPASNDVIGPNTDYQYDWVPIGDIERIEIVRGPMSVLYGSDALGGVINIITRKTPKEWSGNARLTGRLTDGDKGGDGHDVDISLGGSLGEHLQLQLAGRQIRRSAVDSILNANTDAIEGRDNQQLALGLDWQPADGHNITLEQTNGNEKRWYDTVTRSGTAYQSRYNIDRRHSSLGWEGRIGQAKTSLRTYQSTVDISNSATNGVAATDPQKLQENVTEGSAGFEPGERHFITTGLEYRTEKLTHPKLSGGNDKATIKSAYAQDEIELSERASLTLGVRQDDHDAFGSETSPRASLVWDKTDNLALKASYGHGFRAPTLKQVAPGYSFPAGIYIIRSNSDLKPETNDAMELGANYSTDRLTLDAAIFDNRVKNLIDTRFNQTLPSGLQEWVYDNIDEARLRGMELSTHFNVRERLRLTGNYQYLDARDGAGERLERRPRNILSVGVEWQTHGWEASLRAEHLADQLIIPAGGTSPVPAPDYTLWHTRISKPLDKHLEIGAGIDNLTDVRLEEKSSAFRHEEYPRTLWLELRGHF